MLTSIVRPRFTGGLRHCTCRGSSLAFDRLSEAALLCWRRAATSSGAASGDDALRLPLLSLGRTIFRCQGEAPKRRTEHDKRNTQVRKTSQVRQVRKTTQVDLFPFPEPMGKACGRERGLWA